MRIALMVIRALLFVPFYLINLNILASDKSTNRYKSYRYVQHCVRTVVKRGRVNVEINGIENLPKEEGYILYPNHQGLFDTLVFLYSCPDPFSFVAKKGLETKPLIKQVMKCLRCLPIDRGDLRQSMKVIQEMTARVKNGENFLIYAEGTRSRMGNKMNEMKAGSFKAAVKAEAPIVPCALVDSFIPFDENSIREVTVKAYYLKPLYYEEYKDMTTVEIAREVKRRIEDCIEKVVVDK